MRLHLAPILAIALTSCLIPSVELRAEKTQVSVTGFASDFLGNEPAPLGLDNSELTLTVEFDAPPVLANDDGMFGTYSGTATLSSPALGAPITGTGGLSIGYNTGGFDGLFLSLSNPDNGPANFQFFQLIFDLDSSAFDSAAFPSSIPLFQFPYINSAAQDNTFNNTLVAQFLPTSATISVVPEPASVIYAAIAMLGFVSGPYRRRRSRA